MSVAQGLRFLAVEDDPFQRRTVARVLRALGAAVVHEAGDGAEALTLLESAEPAPDVVICDLNMPQMDGMEFIRRLGEGKHTVSMIILSAQEGALLNSVDKMTRAYGVRLLGIIRKPFSKDALAELVARHTVSAPRPASLPGARRYDLAEVLRALEEGQFEPFYQPKIYLADGRAVGAEALARWRHPVHGLVAPNAFIPLLEQSGRLDALTFMMLSSAARDCKAWRDAGLALTVSVNLSLGSLGDTSLADRIIELVQATGLVPQHMVLEITETAAMTEEAPALENLARLRMRGFGLSIDDYGTGFSSLRQLTRVPFTELKIDQMFVSGCALSSQSRTIIESSVQMARRLGISTVAEGVESAADRDVVAHAGCLAAQGYFFAKPLEEAAFRQFCTASLSRASLVNGGAS